MPTIQASGLSSGLDVAGIISKLIKAESDAPLKRLQLQEASASAKISGFSVLKSNLSGLRDVVRDGFKTSSNFLPKNAITSDSEVFTATGDSTAVLGTYNVQVEQLAQNHRLTSEAFTSSVEEVGQGTMTIHVGDESFQINIDGSNDTVTQIRDAINNHVDNKGVTASLLTGDNSQVHLLLSSTGTGLDNKLKIVIDDDDGTDTNNAGLSRLAYDDTLAEGERQMNLSQAAQDAQISVDGVVTNRSSNTISDVIQGVTFTLIKTDPGEAKTLTVSNDKAALKKKITEFVAEYNKVATAIQGLTDVTEDGKRGILTSNPTALNVEATLRSAVNTPVVGIESSINDLFALGIKTTKDNTLEIDADSLDAALDKDFNAASQIFGSTNGIGKTLEDKLNAFVQTQGSLDLNTTSLTNEVKLINEQRKNIDERMKTLKARLERQFTALDTLVSNLNSTGNFLTQQLGMINAMFTRKK